MTLVSMKWKGPCPTLGTDEEREAVWRAECHSLPATAGVGFQDHRQLLWWDALETASFDSLASFCLPHLPGPQQQVSC